MGHNSVLNARALQDSPRPAAPLPADLERLLAALPFLTPTTRSPQPQGLQEANQEVRATAAAAAAPRG